MKNEEFDDAVRRKLEGIEPAFTEADIEKVFRHARITPSPLRWLKGNWHFLAVSAAATVGVTTWLVLKNNDEKPVITDHNITKTEIRVKTGDTLNAKTEKNSLQSEIAIIYDSNVYVNNNNTVNPIINKPPVKQKNSISTHKISLNTTSKPQSNQAVTVSSPVSVSGTTEAIAEKNSKPGIFDQVKLTEQDNTLTDSTLITENKSLTGDEPSSGISSATGADTITQKGNEEKPAKRLFSPGVRITGSLPVSNQSFGIGLGTEILAGQHAGISVGIRYNHTFTETFFTKEALRQPKHDRMGPEFHKRFDGEDVFIDISVSNHIIQLPVSLSYYIPLNQDFKLNFVIGTDFDLHVKQSIDYTHLFDSAGMDRIHLDVIGNATPVNTLYLSAGFEKEWNRLALQFRPFISPHLKQVYYKPKEIEYGINLSLKYRFWGKEGK
jgi:hypothetical protein